MPSLTELRAQPRCTFVGQDLRTQKKMRCARWTDHEEDELGHIGKTDVLAYMTGAILRNNGMDPNEASITGRFIAFKQAKMWWQTLVIQEAVEE